MISTCLNAAFAKDCITCTNELKSDNQELDKLSSSVNKILATQFTKVADLKVNHAGSGDLSILVDEGGNLLAVKFLYEDGKDKKDFTVSIDDFNKGKGIDYPALKNNVSPLKLSAVRPPGINAKTGGDFNLIIGTSTEPAVYKSSSIKLSKKNGEWAISTGKKNIKKVTLSPGLSWAAWNGTFTEAKFE
jgi:hypothetical protein